MQKKKNKNKNGTYAADAATSMGTADLHINARLLPTCLPV
jgi:hypothetical protein